METLTYLFTSRRYRIVELLSLMIDEDSMSYALLSPSSLNLLMTKYDWFFLSNRLQFLSVYMRNNTRGMLEEHEKSL